MNKKLIEDYLISHQFDYWEWNDKKEFLKVYKMNRNWEIPYFEFIYSVVTIDTIFQAYLIDYFI